MSKNLVIVESPAKAKTIEGYLGKDFTVKSSFGHVRDLPKKGMGIDIDRNFEPVYEVTPDKKKVVADLKKHVKSAEVVWLASDEDREGEAISWHLFEALDLEKKDTRRITFNEITKTAITKAIEKPREIDVNLVNAQQARRVLDRLVGFELSPVLWRKIKPSLSAGRVQSVSVRLIVEREREIIDFESHSSFRIKALFNIDGKTTLSAALDNTFDKEEQAIEFLSKAKDAIFSVESLDKKPAKKSPTPPFTTSTLQQEASRKLGFSVARTMSVAQKLYEAGKITYMRTDSVNLSDTAIEGARKEVISAYGQEFFKERRFATKSKSAQEAHEAIRPTDFGAHHAGGDSAEKKLYDLIWKRSIASQMSDAELERTTIKIELNNTPEKFVAKGEIIKFEGFLKAYLEGTDDEPDEDDNDEKLLPPLNVGQELTYINITATEKYSRPKPRYTEASLVKRLEELGIGRPSTYAPTISTIQKRGYVSKDPIEGKERKYATLTLEKGEISNEIKTEITGAEKNKLHPTDIGLVVNDFLVEHFEKILDYGFTASVEKQFDDIAQGLEEWTHMIKTFYDPFHKKIETTIGDAERAKGERILGDDPKSGKKVIARIGRYGPMIQIGNSEEEDKPKFASLQAGQSIATITLEEALELFKLPRTLGDFEGKTVSVAIGRFGPYVRHDNKFASLDKEQDPLSIKLDEAIELIKEKRKKDAEKFIATFDEREDVQVLNGRWGPYVKIGKKNFKIPKDFKKDPKEFTLEDCLEIEKLSKK